MKGPVSAIMIPQIPAVHCQYAAPICGLPTISLPSGLDGNGLPLSIQFIGHHLSEPTLIQVGNAFEKATDFHELHPPV